MLGFTKDKSGVKLPCLPFHLCKWNQKGAIESPKHKSLLWFANQLNVSSVIPWLWLRYWITINLLVLLPLQSANQCRLLNNMNSSPASNWVNTQVQNDWFNVNCFLVTWVSLLICRTTQYWFKAVPETITLPGKEQIIAKFTSWCLVYVWMDGWIDGWMDGWV